jgi:hypothetical protein
MKYLFLILIAAVVINSAVSYSTVKTDDAFIYYSYVQNITSGSGWVFNPGEQINACTSALYPIALSVIHLVTPWFEIPVMAHVFCFCCLFFACMFLFLMFQKSSMRFTVPLLFVANPLLHNGVGMETFLMMACVTGTLYFYGEKKHKLTAIFSALTILARPDMLVFVGLLYGYDIFIKNNLPKISSGILLVLPVMAWAVFSWLYFGNPLPSTLLAKMVQADIDGYGHFINGFNNVPYYAKPFLMHSIWITTLFFAVVIVAFRKKIQFQFPVLMIVAWSVLHTIIYAFVLRTIDFPWYYSYLALPMAVIIGTGIDFVFISMKRVQVYGLTANVSIFVAVVLVAFCIPSEAGKTIRAADQYWKYQMYKNAATYLNTIKNEKDIACCEIGILRYYLKNRCVVDMIGLTNQDARLCLRTGKIDGWLKLLNGYVLANYPAKSIAEKFPVYSFNNIGKIISRNYSNEALKNYRSISLFERK